MAKDLIPKKGLLHICIDTRTEHTSAIFLGVNVPTITILILYAISPVMIDFPFECDKCGKSFCREDQFRGQENAHIRREPKLEERTAKREASEDK